MRPVRIVIPFPPGGNSDAIGRLAAERLSTAIGGTFLADNRPGAAGMLAAESVARAAPDGYTLLLGTSSQISTAPYTNRIKFDPVKDFVPISIVGANPFVITVGNAVPARTLEEFIEHLRANPGRLNYGSGGTGTVTHLSGALFLQRAGVTMTHVPYKGGGPALADVMGGQIQMYSASPSEVIAHVGGGKLRLLGISSPQRAKYLPDVPAIAEVLPGHSAFTWNGLFAPARTPPAIVARLAEEIQKAQRDPAFTGRLEKMGVDPVLHTPAEFAAQIEREMTMWKEVIDAAGIKPQE